MQKNAYRIRYQFNAMHSLDLSIADKMHAHTFRVIAYLENVGKELEKIDTCEKIIRDYFLKYKGFRMNDVPPFRDLVPTIENMCQVFYNDLVVKLAEEKVELLKLELGDSPLASYSVGKKLFVGSAYNYISDEQFQEYSRKISERER